MSRPSRRRVRREPRGYILFLMMVFIPLLGMVSMLAMDRTVGELLGSANQVRDKRAFFRADGSAVICRRELVNRLGDKVLNANLNSQTSVPTEPIGLLTGYAYLSGTSLGTPFVEKSKDGIAYASASIPYPGSDPTADFCTLDVYSRGQRVNTGTESEPKYLFRYNYVIGGNAKEGGITRQVSLQGTFSVLAWQLPEEGASFAGYALFTNVQKDSTGALVWLDSRDNFSGPVHTNGEFNFALKPTFTGPVDSVSPTAKYLNNGQPLTLNADSDMLIPDSCKCDVPSFGGGFQRGSDNIPMPSATDADSQRAKSLGGASTPSSNGVYPGAKDTNGDGKPDTMTGGIYVKGDASLAVGVGGSGIAQYTITVGTTSYTVRVNYGTKQTSIQVGSGSPTTYTGLPNGDGKLMLFVDGAVKSLGGKLQQDSQVTIAATGDIQITDHLRYENYTAGPPPSAEGFTNMLGIISWAGDVVITTGAPDNIDIHASIMTPNKELRVDRYDSGKTRGTATVLGGVIENTYGKFGQYGKTGYGRKFVFDTRMGRGMAPPFFPTYKSGSTVGGKVTSTSAGTDKRANWQQTN